MRTTIYNGSGICAGCDRMLTPLEVMYSGLCPACTATMVRQLMSGRMVAGGNE